jgi:hypothetical protein
MKGIITYAKDEREEEESKQAQSPWPRHLAPLGRILVVDAPIKLNAHVNPL